MSLIQLTSCFTTINSSEFIEFDVPVLLRCVLLLTDAFLWPILRIDEFWKTLLQLTLQTWPGCNFQFFFIRIMSLANDIYIKYVNLDNYAVSKMNGIIGTIPEIFLKRDSWKKWLQAIICSFPPHFVPNPQA